MGKLLFWAIKIIPILTLVKGLTSGKDKALPLFNLGKVAFTQYEMKGIAQVLIEEMSATNKVMEPQNFTHFINENFQNEYSVIFRDFLDDHNQLLSTDLWGKNYKLEPNIKTTKITIVSAGMDKLWGTSDDIKIPIDVGTSQEQEKLNAKHSEREQEEASPQRIPSNSPTTEEEFDEEGRDRDGYDRQGLDRDGYNRDGIHHSEI